MFAALFCVASIIGASALGMYQKSGRTTETNFTELSARVRDITKTQQRLDELEQMITDIEICDPDRMQKNFQFGWQSGSSNRKYDFWADGENETTEDMLYFAQRERQRLRASLLNQIDDLERVRRYGNVTKTIDISAGEGSAWTE